MVSATARHAGRNMHAMHHHERKQRTPIASSESVHWISRVRFVYSCCDLENARASCVALYQSSRIIVPFAITAALRSCRKDGADLADLIRIQLHSSLVQNIWFKLLARSYHELNGGGQIGRRFGFWRPMRILSHVHGVADGEASRIHRISEQGVWLLQRAFDFEGNTSSFPVIPLAEPPPDEDTKKISPDQKMKLSSPKACIALAHLVSA